MASNDNPKPLVRAELSKDGEAVLVTFKYDPKFVKAVKQVPGARFLNASKPEGPAWRVAKDMTTMRKLREEMGEQLGIGPKLLRWGINEKAKEDKLTELSQADDAKPENIAGKLRKWLRPYQRADAVFMASTNAINANQPRTGKTPTTVSAIIEAGLEWGQHLVLAPKGSLRNVWEEGIKAAYAKQGLEEPTILTGDNPKQRTAAIKEAAEMAKDGYAFWLVVNPYNAQMKRKKVEGTSGDNVEYEDVLVNPELLEVDWDSMIVDEFHLMGLTNPTTGGARGVLHIAEVTQPTRRFALSGTPMRGKPVKLWGALHFLDPDKFTSRWTWAKHWLIIKSNSYGSSIEGIMPGREEAFYNHLKPYLVRRTQREALPGLPPVNRVPVICQMTPNQREQYIKMATEAEWRMEDAAEDERLTAANILAEYTRLKQFADAYCEVHKTGKENNGIPELKVQHTQDSGKLEQLLERLTECNVITKGTEDADDPACALVFTQFNPMVDMVADALAEQGVPVAKLHSKQMGTKKGNALVKAFQEQSEGAPRVLVMNTLGGTAQTMDRATSVHILDETWVPDDQEQAENRATPTTEEGMKARIDTGVYYYRTANSIDQYIEKLVADKAMNNRTILDLRRRMQKQIAELERQQAEADAKRSKQAR